MQLHEFLGQVQHRARLDTLDDALRVTRATLETLAERLDGGEPAQLGAQLPTELGSLLSNPSVIGRERLSANDFFQRISAREHADLPDAVFHARAVVDVLADAVSPDVMAAVRHGLPANYLPLFDARIQGPMRGV